MGFLRLLALLIALSPTAWARATFVDSLDDFALHVQAHKARVIAAGLRLKQLYPREFADVSPELIGAYLELHDVNKLNAPGADSLRIQKALYRNWAKNVRAMSTADQQAALATINELNTLDGVVAHEFFRQRGLMNAAGEMSPVAKKLQVIEKIADQVDRGLDPVAREEFGRELDRASAFIKDPTQKSMAEKLEAHYSDIGGGMRLTVFRKLTPCQRALLLVR